MTSVRATSSTISVPGATLYYEVRGSGPTVLIIPGGPQDAGVFSGFANLLADRYKVVTYDPRGNSRSPVEDTSADQQVELHADDAAALLVAVGGEPAHVFGTSGGAQIGFDLTVRYPALVQSMIAHEPASTLMLDDPAEMIAADQELHDIYRREGVDAAMQKFFGDNDFGGDEFGAKAEGGPPPFEMSPEDMETFERVSANFEYFLAHGLMPLSLYSPDVDTLKASSATMVVGLGAESVGQPIHEIGLATARKLGLEPVTFPGDHVGFEQHTEEFADLLHRVITKA